MWNAHWNKLPTTRSSKYKTFFKPYVPLNYVKRAYVDKVLWDTLQYFQGWKIIKYDYNHSFENLKIYNIRLQNAFTNVHKRDKK